MKILLIRMMGFGDVASILIPAVKIYQQQFPEAKISVLTYGPGNELMTLVPGVDAVLTVSKEQWPNDIQPAIESFIGIAKVVLDQRYEKIVNFDTWFMPCFLARFLKDLGQDIVGNYINLSISEFHEKLTSLEMNQAYFQNPGNYLASNFPNMPDWIIPWWDKFPEAGAYPEFYLNHCCGFKEIVDISLDIQEDPDFKLIAKERRIIAVSASGSKANKNYPFRDKLIEQLEKQGFFVWGKFDGSVPMEKTLGRLKVTDLLITVATSTQWLAKLVGCPSLMLPGSLPPSVLGAELVVDKKLECQYCYQNYCPEAIDFACMEIPIDVVVAKVLDYFAVKSGKKLI